MPKSLKEWLKGLFRNPCQKLISYQETTWKFSASVDADKSVTVDLGLEKQVQEVTPATNHAKLLDDFQYLLCKEIERWTEDVNYVSLLSKYRIMAIAYIVCLSQILEDIKVDPTNKALKQELVRISKSMTRLTEDFGNAVRYLT